MVIIPGRMHLHILVGFPSASVCMRRFDSIGAPHARKLSGLALCQLLTLPLPAILERLELIAACLTSVWFEVRRCCLQFD